MYGTVARFRIKAGAESQLLEEFRAYEQLNVPGYVGSHLYRMDADSREFYLAVLFDSKAAYERNAESPEQDQRYQKMRALLETDPEWHDGEVVYGR